MNMRGMPFQNLVEPWMAEQSTTAMDGGSADFAGAKICQGSIHSVFWKGITRMFQLQG
ncbi:hypothetical protein MARHY3485 [Marinobacter nauticus ATCC 49840]|nr:hypothetical protein MARHY3485 [Marinobacter nauticus ATCC 49840]